MSKTTKLNLIAITGFVLLAATGCQTVHVQDQSGNPINWAAVSTGPEGKKASSLPSMTNFLGDATLPKSMTKGRESIQVSKDGYETRIVHRTSEPKITVKLYKIGTIKKPKPNPSGYRRPASSNVSITPKPSNKPIDTRIAPKTKTQP